MNDGSGISPGRDWGEPGTVPGDIVICRGDAEAAAAAAHVGLSGGDLHRSLGSPPVPVAGGSSTILEVDLMSCEVETDRGRMFVTAVSHVLVGRFMGIGRFTGCVNTGFVGGRNLTPRSHPGDGRIEEFTVDPGMRKRERFVAVRRSSTGTHLPHPMITVSVLREWETARHGREILTIDGTRIPRWRRVAVRVNPAGLTVHV